MVTGRASGLAPGGVSGGLARRVLSALLAFGFCVGSYLGGAYLLAAVSELTVGWDIGAHAVIMGVAYGAWVGFAHRAPRWDS
jgi:hypothetical protein